MRPASASSGRLASCAVGQARLRQAEVDGRQRADRLDDRLARGADDAGELAQDALDLLALLQLQRAQGVVQSRRSPAARRRRWRRWPTGHGPVPGTWRARFRLDRQHVAPVARGDDGVLQVGAVAGEVAVQPLRQARPGRRATRAGGAPAPGWRRRAGRPGP